MFIVYSELRQRVEKLVSSSLPAVFAERQVGLEKESLRVNRTGGISQSDHPAALGCALTHPSITTDFSEALLEMVTPPCDSAEQALHYLTSIHQFIVQRLPDGEHIWNTSMPCILRGGQSVRIGQYGHSHSGQLKQAYRRGLGLRYGRHMQAIAGVHFNFSMPESSWGLRQVLMSPGKDVDANRLAQRYAAQTESQRQVERTDGYFQMLQNLLRIGWVVPYLFGASPAICTSFLAEGEGDEFDPWNQTTRYAPHGTSLRMGKIGYRYREEDPIDLSVRHGDINAYIDDIIAHVTTVHPPYEAMGVRDDKGEYQQLSAARLQIENEYYSTVRPKQIAQPGELPILALKERGIRYLELRSVDVNLLEPAGVGLEQIAMLELLMMFAWLATPAPLSAAEMQRTTNNVNTIAHYGRKPGLNLAGPDGDISVARWGREILSAMEPIATWLDSGRQTPLYSQALAAQVAKFDDASLTPSALMVAGVKQTGSFFDHALALSRQHDQWFRALPADASLMDELEDKVRRSRLKQAELEASSHGPFGDYLQSYLDQIHAATSEA